MPSSRCIVRGQDGDPALRVTPTPPPHPRPPPPACRVFFCFVQVLACQQPGEHPCFAPENSPALVSAQGRSLLWGKSRARAWVWDRSGNPWERLRYRLIDGAVAGLGGPCVIPPDKGMAHVTGWRVLGHLAVANSEHLCLPARRRLP